MHIPAGTLIDGRFRIGKMLGEGGMGAVFEAEQAELNRVVAIKFLTSPAMSRTEEFARFQQEAHVLSQLQHKNIVSVYAFGEWRNCAYMVMERVEGTSLQEMLRASEPLDKEFVMDLAMQVCSGLQEAHSHGVVHRDLKPSNLIVSKSGEVKIIDFGLAKLLSPSSSQNQQLTEAGAAVGSVLYMSPEQAIGAKVDGRADIYSLGCVMHHCLAGVPPFVGEHSVVVMVQHTRNDPPPLPQTGNLGTIVSNAMCKNPVDRYQSAREMRADLEVVAKGGKVIQSSSSGPIVVSDVPAAGRKSNWKPIVLASVAAVCACAVFAYFALQQPNEALRPEVVDSQITLAEFIAKYDTGHRYFEQHEYEKVIPIMRSIVQRAPQSGISGPWCDHLWRACEDLLESDSRTKDKRSDEDASLCTELALKFPLYTKEQLYGQNQLALQLMKLGHIHGATILAVRIRDRLLESNISMDEREHANIALQTAQFTYELDKEKAKRLMRIAVEHALNTGNPKTYVETLGWATSLGVATEDQIKKAIELVTHREGLAARAAEVQLAIYLAKYYALSKRDREAIALLDSLQTINPEQILEVETVRATAYMNAGKMAEGRRCLERSADIATRHSKECNPYTVINTYLAAAYLAQNRNDDALKRHYVQAAEEVLSSRRDELDYKKVTDMIGKCKRNIGLRI